MEILFTYKNEPAYEHMATYASVQQNTALLGDCGLTGTPLHASLSGLAGRECSVCVHSVYDEEVGLSSPRLAEVQFVDCVICAL